MADESRPGVEPERVVFGAGLMLLGLALLADRTGWVDLVSYWRLWPLLLVALGVVKMARKKGRGEGAWLAFLGLLLLGQSLHVLPFSQSWPLFIIWAGASVTWTALRGRREGSDGR
jgi:hypothetical protein